VLLPSATAETTIFVDEAAVNSRQCARIAVAKEIRLLAVIN
jgi:hypothetical protein